MESADKFERMQLDIAKEQQKAYQKIEKIDEKILKAGAAAEKKIKSLENEKQQIMADADIKMAVDAGRMLAK